MEASNSGAQTTDRPVGDMFNQVSEDLGLFLGREFARLREEATERARAAARGAGLLTAAGFSGSIAVAAALSLPLIALRRLIGPAGTSAVVAGSAGAVAAYLAKRGLDELGVPADETAEVAVAVAREAIGVS